MEPDPNTFKLIQAQIMYYFIQCHNMDSNRALRDNERLYFKCPNACNQKLCESISFAIDNSCKIKNGGIFSSSYDCNCGGDTLWSTDSKLCYTRNKCKENICGNSECVFDEFGSEYPTYKCNCNEKTMGKHCNTRRNACEYSYVDGGTIGHESCRSHGICIPLHGLNFYKCKCDEGWTDDKTKLNHPNCNAKIDPCNKLICHNGYCEVNYTDPRNPKGYCICEYGWVGYKCSEKGPIWFPWSQWSACDPECGLNRTRIRNRNCSGALQELTCEPFIVKKISIGNTEVAPCAKIKCISDDNSTEYNSTEHKHAGSEKELHSKLSIYVNFILLILINLYIF